MILAVGEILVDMIGKPSADSLVYERKAGGAPFNVCAAINKLGGKCAFLGTVGNDNMGKFLIDFVNKQNIYKSYIKVDDKHNTTLAFVEIDKSGERSFCFYRKNTSDYRLDNLTLDMYKQYNIIHVGSLLLSEPNGVEYIKNIAKNAKENDVLLSFDINFREDIFSSKEAAINIYKEILPLFNIIKISSEEIDIFTKEYIDTLSNDLIFISLGSKGSVCKYKGTIYHAGVRKVKPIDTTGAGDAFYGAILYQLDNLDIKNLTVEQITDILKFANAAGAINTLGYGAIDHLADQNKIKEFLDYVD